MIDYRLVNVAARIANSVVFGQNQRTVVVVVFSLSQRQPLHQKMQVVLIIIEWFGLCLSMNV